MAIAHYMREIGRGKDGARALSREQAADLMAQVLDGAVSDLELGAFCIAMRVKGETAQELAGFLDATQARLQLVAASEKPLIVIPSYNGARKLPGLTALLALLLAREGWPVLIHGSASESTRVYTSKVLESLGTHSATAINSVADGEVVFAPTELLCPGLQRLLEVRRVLGVRNSAHSVVKLMNPCAGAALIVSSYTHPEYAVSMAATFELMQANALLLHGTEGEPVADPRRAPRMQGFLGGRVVALHEAQSGTLTTLPDLPQSTQAQQVAAYIGRVLGGEIAVPSPITQQVALVSSLAAQL